MDPFQPWGCARAATGVIALSLAGLGCPRERPLEAAPPERSKATAATAPDAGEEVPSPAATGSPNPAPSTRACSAIHVADEARPVLQMSGAVTSIRTPPDPHGWTEVDLEGHPRAFELLCSGASPPFSTGERIKAQINCSRGGFHRVCDGVIEDAAGSPLMLLIASGDPAKAAGWTIELGPVTREVPSSNPGPRSVRREHGLVFGREGRTVPIPAGAWAAFPGKGGGWLVTGMAVRWEGLRPPEGVDHSSYAIVRAAP